MEFIFFLLACFLFVSAIVMPWVNHSQILGLKNEIKRLKRLSEKDAKVGKLSNCKIDKGSETVEEPIAARLESATETRSLIDERPEVHKQNSEDQKVAMETFFKEAQPLETEANVSPEDTLRPKQDWFGKLAVWVGGIALLMAGFFMVKYSIESGWMTPTVRLWTTSIFGSILCISGFYLGTKSVSAGDLRIGQALTGAGLACLYFSSYAGVNLYGLISSGYGFTGMVCVTILAVFLSIRHGAPIALMGLMGGFLTPLLVGSDSENILLLLTYLYLLFVAAQFLCIRRGWWSLLFLSLLIVYLWSGSLLLQCIYTSDFDLTSTLLMIAGVIGLSSVTTIASSCKTNDQNANRWQLLIRILACGGGLVQALLIVLIEEFEAVDMVLFSVLSIGALVLAVLRERSYLWVACLALGFVFFGALVNPEPSWTKYFVWPIGVSLIFLIISHYKAFYSEREGLWRWFSLSAICSVVPITYINRELLFSEMVPFSAFWLVLSSIVCCLILILAEHLKRASESNDCLVARYSAVAFFLLGFGLWEFVQTVYLSITIACLLLASAVYWRTRKLCNPAFVFVVLLAGWMLTMVERLFFAVGYFLGSGSSFSHEVLDLLSWYSGGVVSFLVLSWFGGKVRAINAKKFFEYLAGLVAFFALVFTYSYADANGYFGQVSTQSVKGGLTSLIAALSIVVLFLAKRWSLALHVSRWLFGLAIFRVVIVHLFGSGATGNGFFLNGLFWQFGVPFVAAVIMAVKGGQREPAGVKLFQALAMALGFIWATFLIQDYFGGMYLLGSIDTSTELYSYSLVWLLLAVVYQGIGLWRRLEVLHFGSLVLLLLTVGKVFFIDAAELEGLYRVLSFLGLGVALIGIGFFYNKVVFGKNLENSA